MWNTGLKILTPFTIWQQLYHNIDNNQPGEFVMLTPIIYNKQMKDKTILITGATSGIGKATAISLAQLGATISLLVRNKKKAEVTKELIVAETGNKNIDIQLIDLADLASVRKAASELKIKYAKIDILINNAGGIFKERYASADGYELTFAINHLGHFLLTNLLLDNLRSSEKARIINVSSEAQRSGHIEFNDLMAKEKYSSFKAYCQAKLANILFTKGLAKRLAGTSVTSYAVHPGVVRTGFGKEFGGVFKVLLLAMKPFMKSPRQGAKTTLHVATAENIETLNGLYFKDSKVKAPIPEAVDEQVADRLWKESEKLVGLT